LKNPREDFAANGDPVQEIYENVRGEALQKLELRSWAMERVCQYGVVSLFPGFHNDFPFILYTQSVPRPAWSGKTDFHLEKLQQVYEFLTACVEIHAGEDVGRILNTFDTNVCSPACEANVVLMHCPSGAGETLSFPSYES
jgi:hypothetical protein